MFIRQRDKKRASALYKVTDGRQSTKTSITDILTLVKHMDFPHTLVMLEENHFNLVVYCPNDILEFDLRK